MSNHRSDVHAPASNNFDPELYTLRGTFDMAPDYAAPEMVKHRLAVVNELINAGYVVGAGSSRNCGHCGAHIRYAALMVRTDVREFIYVGETCLDNRFSGTKADFDAMRKASKALRDAYKGMLKFEKLCIDHPVVAYATYAQNMRDSETMSIIADIAWKAEKYGELSEKQVAFLDRLMVKADAYEATLREREAAKAVVPAVTVGKQRIEGTVLTTKWQDSQWGGALKMLVQLANGTKVWGTVPAAIDNVDKGDLVSFTATVTASNDDHTFGFYSRPTQARMVESAAA
jgi:hypothetical protein